jgi:hypothetical protein
MRDLQYFHCEFHDHDQHQNLNVLAHLSLLNPSLILLPFHWVIRKQFILSNFNQVISLFFNYLRSNLYLLNRFFFLRIIMKQVIQ